MSYQRGNRSKRLSSRDCYCQASELDLLGPTQSWVRQQFVYKFHSYLHISFISLASAFLFDEELKYKKSLRS